VARKKVVDLGLKLSGTEAAFDDYKNKNALNKKLVTNIEDLEVKLADVTKERDALLGKVEEKEGKIKELEEKLKAAESSAEVTMISEEEKAADPAGDYTMMSRA
ncbi:hypothetical protein A2U01_0069523, partial [Trifolium medium]|nr:hypothetical protein [Trifolium medium]